MTRAGRPASPLIRLKAGAKVGLAGIIQWKTAKDVKAREGLQEKWDHFWQATGSPIGDFAFDHEIR